MPPDQREQWAYLYGHALTASHHREWSADMIEAAARICADVTVAMLASMAPDDQPETPEPPPEHLTTPRELDHGGYM